MVFTCRRVDREHLKTENLYEIFQSASRQLHSTETALFRVQNDLLQAVDNEGGAILVLLDLIAVFDTIDHQKLLNLLNQSFGIRGVALKWFDSYHKHMRKGISVVVAKGPISTCITAHASRTWRDACCDH